MADQDKSGHGGNDDHTVPITIDKGKHRTPEHTTGHALYVLGSVPDGYELWLEVKGHGDDQIIANTAAKIEVKSGSHFYTAKAALNPGAFA